MNQLAISATAALAWGGIQSSSDTKATAKRIITALREQNFQVGWGQTPNHLYHIGGEVTEKGTEYQAHCLSVAPVAVGTSFRASSMDAVLSFIAALK